MSVDIPNPMGIDIYGDVPVALSGSVGISGVPDTFHLDVQHVPKLSIGIEKLSIGVDPLALSLSVRELPKIQVGVDKLNIGLALVEFPSVRAHLPANFKLAFRLFNIDVACVEMCGEAQVITEPYVPHPAERCPQDGTHRARGVSAEGAVPTAFDTGG